MPAPAAPAPYNIVPWFIAMFVLFFFAWLVTGGPDNPRSKAGILLQSPPPLSTGEAYGPTPQLSKIAFSGLLSQYAKHTTLALGTTKNPNGSPESLLLTIPRTGGDTVVSGWKLVNSHGFQATIPNGAEHFVQGKISASEPIKLTTYDDVTISDAASPVGVSFKLDKCSGLLGETQQFVPPITSSCPSAQDLVEASGQRAVDSTCDSFVESLPTCSMGLAKGFASLPASCRTFVAQALSQPACENSYGKSFRFSLPHWRVYLSAPGLLRAEHDTVSIYDTDDKLVGTVTW